MSFYCDQIVGVSQHAINKQWSLLFLQQVIPNSVTISVPRASGTYTVELNAPTVTLGSSHGVALNLHIRSGTVPDVKGDMVDITGYTLSVLPDLDAYTLPQDATWVKLFPATQSQVQAVIDAGGRVNVVLPSIEQSAPHPFVGAIAVPPGSSQPLPSTVQFEQVVNQIFPQLVSDGNPFVMALTPLYGPGTGTQYFLPTGAQFDPTGDVESDTPEVSDYSTLNILIMDQGHSFEYSQEEVPSLTWNTVPDDPNVDGRFYISASEFEMGYVQGILWPAMAEAMGGQASFEDSDSTYRYAWDNSQNGDTNNHGPLIDTDSFLGVSYNVSQISGVDNELNLQLSGYTATSIFLEGSGYFRKWQKVYVESWASLGVWVWMYTIDVKQPFELTVTLSAASGENSGAFIVDVDVTPQGVIRNNDKDVALDTVSWLLDLYNDHVGTLLNDIANSLSSFESRSLDSFTSQAKEAMDVLSETIILPSGAQYLFENLTVKGNWNVQIDFTMNS